MRIKHWNRCKIVGVWLEDDGQLLIRSWGFGLSSQRSLLPADHCEVSQVLSLVIDFMWFSQSAPQVGSQLSPTAEADSEAGVPCQHPRAIGTADHRSRATQWLPACAQSQQLDHHQSQNMTNTLCMCWYDSGTGHHTPRDYKLTSGK